ncbi:MAG TPA: MerR family transcriptional regulator [Chloroflexota bacterium]|nr:MerR family transcriptional regulator [Chloroflexota bacterium]
MPGECWTVGELARRTGLTVRALHHYDEIGLLRPAHRSEAGYRLYAPAEVTRLLQIQSLRQLGFSLTDIRALLDRPDMAPRQIVALHLRHLEDRIGREKELAGRLRALAWKLDSAADASAAEIAQTIEVMNLTEKFQEYFTPEQLDEIHRRAELVGEERIRESEAEWATLIAAMRAALENGTDPADDNVQAMATRWQGLIREFSGGNPEIEKTMAEMYRNEPKVRDFAGVDPALLDYVGKAMAARQS